MHLLMLGGTVFLGRSIVEAALARGHAITLFNRGQHEPNLFPEAEHVRGDRNGDLDALRGKQWDAVIDTSGYVPRAVRATAELLADAVGNYTFISSISAYASMRQPGMDESAPLGTLDDPTIEQVTGETYGPLKALCEQVVQQVFPDRALIIRPGLIVGPWDRSERFGYWVRRIARGGDVLVPDVPDQALQIIDVRDLAEWIVRLIEDRVTGVFNAVGPAERLTFAQFFETARRALNSDANLHWIAEDFLLEHGVQPFSELPLWLPSSDSQFNGFMRIDHSQAIAHGLRFRPLADTIRDTWQWERTVNADAANRELSSLAADREDALLDAWHNRW